jgi:hypothetical protein
VNVEDPEQKVAYSTKAPLLTIFDVAVKAQERIKVQYFNILMFLIIKIFFFYD